MSGPSGGDEVGKVLASFTTMASRLREDRSKMEEYISSLEKVNRNCGCPAEIIRSENWPPSAPGCGGGHEVGNPTGAILGYLTFSPREGWLKPEKADVLKRRRASRANRRIVRELLEFSRPLPAGGGGGCE